MSLDKMISRIDVSRDQGVMELVWQDDVRQEIRLEDLRRLCPCALCEGSRLEQDSDALHIITADEMQATAGVGEITPVGRYAIQIRWDDGHDTGIYTYKYLRTLGTTTPS